MSNKGLVSRIYTKLSKLNNIKQTTQLKERKKGASDLSRYLSKKDIQMEISI